MNELFAGFLGALLATNPAVALGELVESRTGLSLPVQTLNDPVEREFQKLLAADDAAQEEIDRWNRGDQTGSPEQTELTLRARIQQRLEPVRKAYEEFLKRHPDHARARIAYGSFLTEVGEEEAARLQYEKGRDLDPTNPAAWNNLANWHGHNGPVTKAFEYYGKALELAPRQPVYYQNLATTVYLFRRDAAAYYQLTEPEVFQKAMGLYRKALELDPDNFVLATDYAQSYYGWKPPKTGDPEADRRAEWKHYEEGLAAWQTALKLAGDDLERQGVLIHFARLEINLGRFDQARRHLLSVTNQLYANTKKTLTRKLDEREKQAGELAPRKSSPE